MHHERLAVFAMALGLLACKSRAEGESSVAPTQSIQGTIIEAAPEHLRGRVALPAGARLYSRPTYASPSWELLLPEPPAIAADAPARVRAFRSIGVVRSGGTMEFLAVTNDLEGEDPAPRRGCGPRFHDLDHLRTLLYVPLVYLAEVTTRELEFQPWSWTSDREQMRMGAGARVGAPAPDVGLPPPPPGASWRWVDADGIRVLAPIPDDAIGRAWDPARTPELRREGEELMQDPEGSMLWLGDEGGAEVVLGVRNDCAEHRRVVDDPGEVESLRALAMDVFYDQSPPLEPEPPSMAEADFMLAAGTPLRWPDGELAGEVLIDWAVSVGIGQTWGDRRCFGLELSGELRAFEEPALACVRPEALTPLSTTVSFESSDTTELGGSIEIGPPEILAGQWSESMLRPIFNHHHETVAECLRPLLGGDEPVEAARWVLAMIVDVDGRVDSVELTALAHTHDAVEDCLRAEAFTWQMPMGGGQVLVPVTIGDWTGASLAKPEARSEPGRERKGERRGEVVIIRDDEPEGGE